MHSRLRYTTLFLILFAVTSLTASPARAASLGEKLDELVETGGDGTYRGINLLERVGASYDGYAYAERLLGSADAYLVEMRLTWREREVRMPIKVRRADDGWHVDWAPKREYVRRIVELLDGGGMVELEAAEATPWSDQTRMPALPVIVDENRATTPFGQVPLVETSELEASEKVGRHVGRWVDRVLQGDRAPAALDIIAHRDAPWDRLSRVLLTAAGAGFFRLHLVAARDGQLVAIPALAPVFESGGRPSRDASLIVAMSADRDRQFRISVAGQLLESGEDCGDDWSLCLEDDGAFETRLAERLQAAFPDGPPSVSHVMFAAQGATPVGEALRRAIRVPGALGIPPDKLYLGYTQ